MMTMIIDLDTDTAAATATAAIDSRYMWAFTEKMLAGGKKTEWEEFSFDYAALQIEKKI